MLSTTKTLSYAKENVNTLEFSQLVEKYHKQAYNVAFRMTGNHEDAEDLCQNTFIRAFRFFQNYNPEMPFEGWLYKIMSNVNIDTLRKRPKFQMRSIDQPIVTDSGEALIEIADNSENPLNVTLSNENHSRIIEAVNSLQHIFKITIILADIEMLSYEEIAKITNTNIGTVRSRLHRGRKILKEILIEKNIIGNN